MDFRLGLQHNILVSTEQHSKDINFYQKNSSKNTEPKYQYFNRCAVWNVFSKDEEKALVEYLVIASNMHYGLSKPQLKKLAFEYVKANAKKYPTFWDKNSKAGEQWYSDFMKRNNKFLSLRKPQATSLARATSFNKANVSFFFSKYLEVFSKYMFLPECIWMKQVLQMCTHLLRL